LESLHGNHSEKAPRGYPISNKTPNSSIRRRSSSRSRSLHETHAQARSRCRLLSPLYAQINHKFPPTLNVQIHLASSQKYGTRHPSYRYNNTRPGFAEYDLDEFDKIGASLAWSRTLTLLRNAFDIAGPDLETVWENHARLEFAEKDADKIWQRWYPAVRQPRPNHDRGIGHDELRRFYADFFIPGKLAGLANATAQPHPRRE